MKRLVLFDIDGTLLTTNGAARRAFHRALLEVYRTAGPIATHPFDGKTDPQIARELLTQAGLGDAQVDASIDTLFATYLRYLAEELASRPGAVTAMPGVHALIDTLAARADRCVLGLLTGNVERGASLKLGAVGLDRHFAFGAFGSDHERRSELPAVAVRRARERTGAGFTGKEIIIIGDTPHDIVCGQALGVRAIGVATGPHTADVLAAAGADLVLENFSDTAAACAAILE